jgi:hypothetical protein
MAKDIVWVAVAVSIAIGSLTWAFWPVSKGNVVVVTYDCSMLIGGWHPDVPAKVQEECRKRELNK